MATRFDDEELQRARESLQSLAEKSEQLQASGGTLDRNGEPKLTADRGKGFSSGLAQGREQESAARPLMDAPNISDGPSDNLPGDDSHITGAVGGREKGRPSQAVHRDAPAERPKRQEAMLRPTKLIVPTVRPMRPANADGATSFHFSHEAISKTRHEQTTARGTKNRAGAAKDHVRYLERDGAVAQTDEETLQAIQEQLAEAAKHDADIAARLGLASNDAGKAPEEASQGFPEPLGAGALASVYIEREEALAHDANGSAVLFSNISDDPVERRDFWQLVERNESDPSEDRLHLRVGTNREFWNKVAVDDDCPKKLKQAIAAANADEIAIIKTRDNQLVREIMKRHGWKPREKRPANETDEEKSAREEREAAHAFGAHFEDGRGGRVQFRTVGELPYEVSHEARVRILRDFTKEFERRNLPFVAVMHAPDHTNDDRNWHFHLVYHDRPIKRFTGHESDHLCDLADDAGPKKTRQHEIAASALRDPEVQKHIGQWDFMVPWTYRKRVSGNRMTTHPFAQPKDREVTRLPFIPKLRRDLANLTNRELEAAGLPRRVDPRRYTEMGIHKESDEHLGTRAAQLEGVGIPTEAGIRNELNQWEYIQRDLEAKKLAEERRIDAQLRSWRGGMKAAELTPVQEDAIEKEIIRFEQAARVAAEHEAIAKNLEQHMSRLRSRAEKVEKMAKKHLDAIEAKRATARQVRSADRYRDKLEEASIHLAGLELLMVSEIAQIANSQAAADRHGRTADECRGMIDTLITAGRARRLDAERTVKPIAANENLKTLEAANDGQTARSKVTVASADRFIEKIIKERRRLEMWNGFAVPRERTAEDNAMITSEAFQKRSGRLAKIYQSQATSIAALVTALKSNPGMLKRAANYAEQAEDAPMQKRFRIATKDRTLQAAFQAFGSEPEIRFEIRRIDRIAEDRAAAANQAALSEKPVAAPEAKPATKPVDRKVANDNERIIETIRAKHLRPTIVPTQDGLSLSFAKQDAALFNLPAQIEVTDQRTIARIEGIAKAHDRAVKRLLAFIEKSPAKVRAGANGAVHSLDPSAPAALQEIARNFARDPQLERAMANALVTARLEAADPRNNPSVETPEPSKPKEKDPFTIVDGKIVWDYGDLFEVDDSEEFGPRESTSPYGKVDPSRKKPAVEERDRTIRNVRPDQVISEHEMGNRKARELALGINAKFDAWIKANREGDRKRRIAISNQIRADAEMRKLVREFDAGIIQSFEADWHEADQQARRNENERDRGNGPERKP